jgi:fatty acid desaturase
MNALHVNSDARRALEEHVKAEALRITGSDSKRRDPLGIVLASIFLALGLATAWLIWMAGGWWWFASPIAGFFLVFGAAGLSIDIPRKERDARGRPV